MEKERSKRRTISNGRKERGRRVRRGKTRRMRSGKAGKRRKAEGGRQGRGRRDVEETWKQDKWEKKGGSEGMEERLGRRENRMRNRRGGRWRRNEEG